MLSKEGIVLHLVPREGDRRLSKDRREDRAGDLERAMPLQGGPLPIYNVEDLSPAAMPCPAVVASHEPRCAASHG